MSILSDIGTKIGTALKLKANKDGTLINDTNNLDDIVENGIYRWNSNIPINAPTGSYHNMTVQKDGNQPTQMVWGGSGSGAADISIRRMDNGTWNGWTHFGGISSAGLATAWVNFAGSNGSIRASHNISSVTRTATGQYKITFASPMNNDNYTFAGGSGNNGATTASRSIANNGANTTTNAYIRVTHTDSTAVDDTLITVVFHGGI